MAITTYTELQAEIASWLNRDDLTSTIPTLIGLAEEVLFGQVRISQMIKRVRTTLDEDFEARPSDFLETVSIKLRTTPEEPVYYVDPAVMDILQANGASGRPRYYTAIGTELTFYPEPDQSYEIELRYYAKPDALSGSVASNAILANWPSLYLFGALAASAPFMREDERLGTWEALLRGAMTNVETADPKVTAMRAPLMTELSSLSGRASSNDLISGNF